MIDLYFWMAALAFVVLATVSAVATTSPSARIRNVADKAVNGSAGFALVSILLAVWFLIQPPA